MSAIETFGVTPDGVRRHHFPHLDAFSASTSPSSATVAEMIDAEAGRLAGALLAEAIPTSAITQGTAAHAQCARILRLMAARSALEAMTGKDPEIAKRWDREIDRWFESLDELGPTFLGDDTLGTLEASDADGPTDHISEYGLEVGTDTTDASDAIMPLRKDNLL